MADILTTAVSALEAFQQALSVTGNNIANASTPGYTRESVTLAPALAQNLGTGYVGSGVNVTGVARTIDQFAQAQAQSANQAVAQQNALVSVANQVDSTLGNSSNGIAAALSAFYGSLQTLSTNPSSTSLRSAVLAKAQALSQSITQTGNQLSASTGTINGQVASAVSQINSLTTNIATLNAQIAQASTQGPAQAPNSLLDQRDQLVSQLSQLIGVRTNPEPNGTLDVYVGSGQAVVVGNRTTPLSTGSNPYNAAQLDVVYGTGAAAQDITGLVSGGSLSGLLQAQAQIVTPALNGLGQIATAVALSFNNQQALGVTANNTQGGNVFSLPAPTVTAASTNTGVPPYIAFSAAVTNVGALGVDNYILKYTGSGWSAIDAQTGASVPLTYTAANAGPPAVQATIQIPAPASGAAALTLTLSGGTPNVNDTFLVQPTAAAATGLTVSLTDPNGIAAAGFTATAGAANAGSTGYTALTYAGGPALPAAATTIIYVTPTSYTFTIGAGAPSAPVTYTPGSTVSGNGWSFVPSGTPAAGDSFTIPVQSGTGTDNTNALALAQLQTSGVLGGGTTSVSAAYSALVGQIGTSTQSATTAQTALQAVATQATQHQQSVSGVNLDEEGAKLIQWQQAYTAAGRVVSVADSLFTTLLTAIQNG